MVSLKKRSPAEGAECRRLNEKIGEQTMEIELLREKIRLLEVKDFFEVAKVEEMSQSTSLSTGQKYGLGEAVRSEASPDRRITCARLRLRVRLAAEGLSDSTVITNCSTT